MGDKGGSPPLAQPLLMKCMRVDLSTPAENLESPTELIQHLVTSLYSRPIKSEFWGWIQELVYFFFFSPDESNVQPSLKTTGLEQGFLK